MRLVLLIGLLAATACADRQAFQEAESPGARARSASCQSFQLPPTYSVGRTRLGGGMAYPDLLSRC
jgi:hypothetical protein